MSAPISRHFYETLSSVGMGRAQEYMDVLNEDGSIMQTIKVGSPAPVETVREAVDRANQELST